MNLFTREDENAGLKTLGIDDINDKRVVEFNNKAKDKYSIEVEKQYQNVFKTPSDEEWEEYKKQGKANFMERIKKHRWHEITPYWGSSYAGISDLMIYKNLKQMKDGKLLSPKEQEETKKYLKDLYEMEARGVTFAGGLADGVFSTAPYLLEAGIGFLTTPEGVGLASLAQTASKFSLREGAKGYAKNEIRKQLKKQARTLAFHNTSPGKLAKDSTVGLAKFTLTKTPTEILRKYGELQLEDELAITNEGQYILSDAEEKPYINLLKAFGDTMIENFSETSGVLFGAIGGGLYHGLNKVIHKNILTKMPAKFIDGFSDLTKKVTGLTVPKALAKFGYNGILEEMGEERIGDLMRFAFNLDENEGYDFEGLVHAIFPGWNQLASEAVLFALMGGGTALSLHGAKMGSDYSDYKKVSKDIAKQSRNDDGSFDFEKMKALIKEYNSEITDDKLEKTVDTITKGISKVKDYSINDFLVDVGIIRTPYKMSLAEKQIVDILQKNGVTPEGIEEVLKFASKDDIGKLSALKEPDYNLEDVKNTIKDIYANSGRAINLDKKQVDDISSVFSTIISSIAKKENRDIEEVANELLPNVEQLKGYVYADENGKGFTSEDIQKSIEGLYEKLNNLGDKQNEKAEKTANEIINDINLLEGMKAGEFDEENSKRAIELLEGKSNWGALFQDAKENINIKPVRIDSDSVPNFNTINKLKNWIYDNLQLLGTVNIKANNRNVQFSKTSVNRSLKGVQRDSVKRNSYAGLKELVENAQYGYEKPADEKHQNKVKGQELYYNAFTYNGETYGIEISIDIPLNENTQYTYAGHKIKIIKAPAASEVIPQGSSFVSPEATYSITDIQSLFNPDVKTFFQSVDTAGAEGDEVQAAKKEWEEKGTESKYFKKWFGDSKIVDKNGEPIPVYHGSLWKFDQFKKGGEFDFSFTKSFAYDYASSKSFEQELDRSPIVYKVYLNVQNPFDFRDEKQVDALMEKLKGKEIRCWGNTYTTEQFKDEIMGLSVVNTTKTQNDFDNAEVGKYYSPYNNDVSDVSSSVSTDRIVFKNDKYFVAIHNIEEPQISSFRIDENDVYEKVEQIAKNINFGNEDRKTISIETTASRNKYSVEEHDYIKEEQPFTCEVLVRKIDSPKFAQKESGYDNWTFFEATDVDGVNLIEILKENGYDGYYKQEKKNLNISVFNPEQIKSVDNQGTFNENNPNIYFQTENFTVEELENIGKFRNFVDRALNKKLTKQEKSKPLNIGKTPAKLLEAGLPNNNISIGYKIIEKAQDNRNKDHNLSKETISRVYEALYNPIAIIKGEQNINEKTLNNRYSIILDLKNDSGNYVLVAIEADKKNGNILLNDIRSIHSRGNFEPIIDKALNDRRLLKIDRDKIKDLLTPEIQPDIISGGAASLLDRIYQKQNNVKYYQSAYHGTPHRFDEFSTDKIGTGEGAQAHGWGLYFAADKNISDGYRKTLSGDTYNNEKYYYNNKLINDANKKAILATIIQYGKDRVIEVRKKTLFRLLHSLGDYNQKEYETKEKELKWIESLDENKIEKKTDKGQLFEVDIPESDVLLDEDKTYNEQSDEIKEILKQVLTDEKFSEYLEEEQTAEEFAEQELTDWEYGFTGGNIYDRLSKLLGSDKEASLLLNEYGIKGITYNGYEDGRCYVIFDNKAVDVLKTYYQSANIEDENFVDLTGDFDKSPSIDEVREYINKIVEEGTKFATLSPDWFVDVRGGSRTKNKILNAGNYKKLTKMERKRHNKYLMSLEKLLAGAEYLGEKENTKKDKKPSVAKYHYFKTNVKIGDKTYEIIFDTEEYINDKTASVGYAKRNFKKTEADTNILPYQDENFKPRTVHLYNITEKKSGIRYQENNEQMSVFPEVNELRRKLKPVKGAYIPAERFIKLFKTGDRSTIIHEAAHAWLDIIVKRAENNEEIKEDLDEIRKFLKNNGEDFTVEQHEKFARGFEAYIRSGNARNNKIKKIFEDFKNFLINLYENIKMLGWEEKDMPEAYALFDRLLSSENERIKAKVFDKCDLLNEQIKKIKIDEEAELEAIRRIKDNDILTDLEYRKYKKKVDEYLQRAEKSANRLPEEIRDWQRRYKNAVFEILETITGYKRQFIANPKNWDKIHELINDAEDKITVSGGMRNHWMEFFSDTGVNYDTDEVGGDYELGEEAYNALVNESWEKGIDEIDEWFGKFNYLSNLVKKETGENKEAALEAMSSLFDSDLSFMPDIAMDEISEKLSQTYSIREQLLMKDKLSPKAPSISLAAQLRAFVANKIHNMKTYDPEQKRIIRLSSVNSLYSLIKNANTVSDTETIIRKINSYAISELENRQKGILHKEIQKQIKINSKLVKVSNIKRGKFDWKTNTVFSELKEINKWDKEAIEEYKLHIGTQKIVESEERGETENIEDGENESLKFITDKQELLKSEFIEYRASVAPSKGIRTKFSNLNIKLARKVLEGILELKFEGRRAKTEEELKKALTKYDYKNDLIERLEKIKNNGLAKYIARYVSGNTIFTSEGTLANWETLLNALFGKEIAQKYSLLNDEAQVEVYARRVCKKLYDGANKIYGFNKSQNSIKKAYGAIVDYDNTNGLVKLIQEYDKEKYTYIQYTFDPQTKRSVGRDVEMTRNQIITAYANSLNPKIKKRLVNQFGDDENNTILNDMFSHLSQEDKSFAWLMVDVCDSMYEDINEVFINTVGLSLPKVENYIPSVTERVLSDLDMLHECIVRSNSPSFSKERANCSKIKMNLKNPFEIMIPHINKAARYVIMSEKINFYNKIFKENKVVAEKIKEVFGEKNGTIINQRLINQLDSLVYSNYTRGLCVGKNILDTISRNYITAAIGGNTKVALSQLTSCINYMENMPVATWSKGFIKGVANPKETVRFMFDNCEYLKARFSGNSQNEIIVKLTDEADKFRSVRQLMTSNTKFGDIGAIIFGGKPYVDYLIERGMTKEEAFKKFTEDTLRSQQSGHMSATSLWQKKMSENGFLRMFFAFNNTNLQYERKFVDIMAQASRGEIKPEQFIKSFLIYKIFNPVIFSSFLTDLALWQFVRQFIDGDDDDIWKNLGVSAGAAVFLSPFKAYGFLGYIAYSICSIGIKAFSADRYFKTQIPVLSDFEDIAMKLFSKAQKGKLDELTFEDWASMLAVVSDYTLGGIPVNRLLNGGYGLNDIIEGKYAKGSLRMLGFGNYRAGSVTGEE